MVLEGRRVCGTSTSRVGLTYWTGMGIVSHELIKLRIDANNSWQSDNSFVTSVTVPSAHSCTDKTSFDIEAIMVRWCERSMLYDFMCGDSLLIVPEAINMNRMASTALVAYRL